MNKNFSIPTLSELKDTRLRIQQFVHHTPVLTSTQIDRLAGAKLFFKCENFQKVGAFKFRGAINAVLQLSEEDRQRGVATHSSGNHAQALAMAAKMNGIKAYIVMPTSAPKVKSEAVAGYGAEIIWCEPNLAARESTLARVISKTGAVFIHPYDNYDVICGQSTVTQELIEKYSDLDIIVAPVGGGGLLSGTALAANYANPTIKVIAAEPHGADDAYRSFKSGQLVPSTSPNTIADGLLTSLSPRTFSIIQQYVNDIYTVDDAAIITAMQLIWERMKIIIEPSSAVALAIILKNKEFFAHKKVGIILSGGNIDLITINSLLAITHKNN